MTRKKLPNVIASALRYLDAAVMKGETVGTIETVMMSRRDYMTVRRILGENDEGHT